MPRRRAEAAQRPVAREALARGRLQRRVHLVGELALLLLARAAALELFPAHLLQAGLVGYVQRFGVVVLFAQGAHVHLLVILAAKAHFIFIEHVAKDVTLLVIEVEPRLLRVRHALGEALDVPVGLRLILIHAHLVALELRKLRGRRPRLLAHEGVALGLHLERLRLLLVRLSEYLRLGGIHPSALAAPTHGTRLRRRKYTPQTECAHIGDVHQAVRAHGPAPDVSAHAERRRRLRLLHGDIVSDEIAAHVAPVHRLRGCVGQEAHELTHVPAGLPDLGVGELRVKEALRPGLALERALGCLRRGIDALHDAHHRREPLRVYERQHDLGQLIHRPLLAVGHVNGEHDDVGETRRLDGAIERAVRADEREAALGFREGRGDALRAAVLVEAAARGGVDHAEAEAAAVGAGAQADEGDDLGGPRARADAARDEQGLALLVAPLPRQITPLLPQRARRHGIARLRFGALALLDAAAGAPLQAALGGMAELAVALVLLLQGAAAVRHGCPGRSAGPSLRGPAARGPRGRGVVGAPGASPLCR
mmetsp:Transcript_24907/g.77951  ORF Transcript_24907/g.77951 Transcript_24907/m.77951 type:complete len:538 (+) Transcript_24907:2585-4198(+)